MTENEKQLMICVVNEIPSICRPVKASKYATISGIKFWCYQCHRYVVVDENHELIGENEKNIRNPREVKT